MTISLDEDVYEGLYRTVGRRHMGQFIEDLRRPHVSIRLWTMDTGRWPPIKTARPLQRYGATLFWQMWPMKRGEVWWVEYDPAVGSEIRKTRPAVIVSNDAANRTLARAVVVALTGNTGHLCPGEACCHAFRQTRQGDGRPDIAGGQEPTQKSDGHLEKVGHDRPGNRETDLSGDAR
ncbi:MAG: type II toxin-antitoxin system PemK/MazF family toxin [Leptospirales bacterium]